MKPFLLPFYRDGGRLLLVDLAEIAKPRAERERRFSPPYGKQAMRLLAWPNAKWWRALVVGDAVPPFESRDPRRDEAVVSSWQRLGDFQRWDVASFADALHLLVETPSVETFGNGAMPEGGLDPRPFLSNRESVRAWFVEKEQLWEPAIARLRIEGRLPEEAAKRLRRHRPSERHCPEPHALVHLGYTGDLRSLRWDDRIVRSSLPFFRGGSLRQIRKAAALVETHLGGDGRQVSLMQRFLVESSFATSAPWLALISVVCHPERRKHFLERLAASGAKWKSPCAVSVPLVEKIEQRARRHGRECLELAGLFTMVEKGIEPSLLEDAITVAELFPRMKLDVTLPAQAVVRPDLSRFVELRDRFACGRKEGCLCWAFRGGRVLQSLWEESTTSRELAREIDAATWREFPEVDECDWVDFLRDLHEMKLKPREFRGMIDRVRRSILREPSQHRRVKARALTSLIGCHLKLPAPTVLNDLETLATTVAAGFASIEYGPLRLFHDLYEVASHDQRWSLGNLPRSVVKHLKEATRNYQESDQIEKGGILWMKLLPEADPALHFRRPKRFLETLRDLGTLPEADAEAVCAFLRDHPGFGIDPRRIGLHDACFLFDTILRDGESDPMPEKLRAAACGRLPLSLEATHHYREEFAARLADYQIDLFQRRIREVEERYRTDGLDPHSVRFLAALGKSNRRSLKRFLRAIRSGQEDYREAHPANRGWLEKHHRLNLGEWIAGGTIDRPVELPGFEGAFVRLEDDPQEVLKMGTYTDTCLAIGGCNQHAAVANTLDVNKRVAFLRDREGRPLARQLLAISEEETLVPFSVYRIDSGIESELIERVFRDFDLDLAERLGIPRWQSGAEYRIPGLVAKEWYDDRAWQAEE
jgi:hypothetical protein